jgi:hypothetical protein
LKRKKLPRYKQSAWGVSTYLTEVHMMTASRVLIFFVCFFSCYGFGLPSKLIDFQSLYTIRYSPGPGQARDSILVLGTFPNDDELMGLTRQGTKLYLFPFEKNKSELIVGNTFATQWYQSLTFDLQQEIINDWTPDDNFFVIRVGQGTDGPLVNIATETYPMVAVAGSDWINEFGDGAFTNVCQDVLEPNNQDAKKE